jgi:hypothetical protein
MSNGGEDVDREFVVEDKDDYVARKSLEDLFEQVTRARDSLVAVRLARNDSGKGQDRQTDQALADARIQVATLIEELRPVLRDTEMWDAREIGRVTVGGFVEQSRSGYDIAGSTTVPETTVKFDGLEDVYEARDGLSVRVADDDIREVEVPLHILQEAYGLIREWLVEQDLALPLDDGGPHSAI